MSIVFFLNLDDGYDATSVYQLQDFIKSCRKKLIGDSNLFWVVLQSNQLADTDIVQEDFNKAYKDMKEVLRNDGWILPQLELNMRNQINISNIRVEGHGVYPMQSAIPKLESGTTIVGELPILLKVSNFRENKDQILTHCVQEMNKKDKKNTVIVYDYDYDFKYVGKDLKRLLKDKTVIEYPSNKGKKKDLSNIKDFVEKDDHILFTKRNYFNGCESSKIIYLNYGAAGQRNVLMRGVKDVILVEVGEFAEIRGMKKDIRFN